MTDTAEAVLDEVKPIEITATELTTISVVDATLAELKKRAQGVIFDMTVTADNDAARLLRRNLVTLRTSTDRLRKDANAPHQVEIDKNNALAKRITTEIKAIEEPLDAQIQADERRRDALREEKRRAEGQRVAAHEAALKAVRARLTACIGQPAKVIETHIAELQAMPERDWEEYEISAREAVVDVSNGLQTLLRQAREAEELARLRAADQQRQQAEAEQRRKAEEAAASEERRKSTHRDLIRSIELTPNTCIGMDSHFIGNTLRCLEDMRIVNLDEFTDEAHAARTGALQTLRDMLAQTQEAERVAEENAAAQRELEARRQAEAAEQRRQAEAAAAATAAAQSEERRRTKRLRDAAELMHTALLAVRASAAWDSLGDDAANKVETALAAAKEGTQ